MRNTLALLTALLLGAAFMIPPEGGRSETAHAATAEQEARAQASSTVVTTMVTGDKIVWPGGGGPRTPIVKHARERGVGNAFVHLKVGPQHYAFPHSAMPYLFRQLDPALFSVEAMRPRGKIRVRLAYRANVETADIPGVTITRQTADGATGYLTQESAEEFGAALARQFAADRRDHNYRNGGLFAKVKAIEPISGGSSGNVRPTYEMHTLSVKVLNHAGKPLPRGIIGVVNTDDKRKFGTIAPVSDGIAKFSVPAGHYTLATQTFRYTNEERNASESRFVTRPEVRVTDDRKVTLDLRQATTEVRVLTPTPANVGRGELRYARFDARDSKALLWDWSSDGNTTFLVSPTADSAVGSQRYYSRWRMYGEHTLYDLKFPSGLGGIPEKQVHRVHKKNLATAEVTYPSEVGKRPSDEFRVAILPWERDYIIFGHFQSITAPQRRTEYITGGHDIEWRHAFMTYAPTFGGIMIAAWRTWSEGQHEEFVWGGHPQHPSMEVDTGVHPDFAPSLTRSGDIMNLYLFPFGDPTVLHAGARSPGQGSQLEEKIAFSLRSGGEVLAKGGYPYVQDLKVPPEERTYRIVLDTTRRAPWFKLSNRIHTEWKFRSKHVENAELPNPDWTCVRFVPGNKCAATPLPMLYYEVQGIDLTNSVPAGDNSVRITVEHAQGAKPPAVTDVQMKVSFDGGKSWKSTSIEKDGEEFVAHYTVPEQNNGFVALRTSAKNADGNAISQTIWRAYQIAEK